MRILEIRKTIFVRHATQCRIPLAGGTAEICTAIEKSYHCIFSQLCEARLDIRRRHKSENHIIKSHDPK